MIDADNKILLFYYILCVNQFQYALLFYYQPPGITNTTYISG